MHGLIFETSIWLLAGSTRLHLHTSTELRSSVACAQPNLCNKSLITEGDYKTLSHTTVQSTFIRKINCLDKFPSLSHSPKPLPNLHLQSRIWITPHHSILSFGFTPNTVSELAAAIRVDNSHKTTPAICQFNYSSFSASKPPGEVDDQ